MARAGGAEQQTGEQWQGQCGATKELHKVPAKELTPEVGEEITRTASQFPEKGEDARGDTPLSRQVSAACTQAHARAAGGRAPQGEQRGHVPTEPPAPPCLACPLACPDPLPLTRAHPCGQWFLLHSRHYYPEQEDLFGLGQLPPKQPCPNGKAFPAKAPMQVKCSH